MTAEPISPTHHYDPSEILDWLPESERDRFLGDYHHALDEAHEVRNYKQLNETLHL
jgi:hypothetical protein